MLPSAEHTSPIGQRPRTHALPSVGLAAHTPQISLSSLSPQKPLLHWESVPHGAPSAIRDVALALPPVALAVVGFSVVQPGMGDCPADTPRWIRQTMCAAVASVLAVVMLLIGK